MGSRTTRLPTKLWRDRGIADSWAYMWTQGKVSTHLIRHLAGGYEYRVYVRSCSTTQCNSAWAYGGTVWTEEATFRDLQPHSNLDTHANAYRYADPNSNSHIEAHNGYAPQLIRYDPSHTPQTYLVDTEYRIHVTWTASVLREIHLEVAWREKDKGDEWTVIGPEDFTWHMLRYLKPSTTYEAKARHWHKDWGYGPWSEVYQIVSADEPPPLVVCEVPIRKDGSILYLPDPQPSDFVTHISSAYIPNSEEHPGPAYLGMFGSQSTTRLIKFTNPSADEWEYGFKLRERGTTYSEIVIRSDKTWEVRIYRASSGRRYMRVLFSGIAVINTKPGETNEFLYSRRGGVWGYNHGIWVNGEWREFGEPGPSGRWVDAIVIKPERVKVPVTEIRWGSACDE